MREIKIDFDNPGLPQRLDVVENDAQSRFFKAVLYKDGKAYAAPSGVTYSIMYRGFGPQNEGWYDTINDGSGKRAACSVSGNVVTCEIARQALRVPGHVSVVLCVTGSNGYMLHGWPIDCNCRNDNYTCGTSVESFFYITQVTNADWTSAIQTWEELKNMIDPTLSVEGKAADAAKVGEAVGQLMEGKVDKPSAADDSKIPRAKGGDVEWVDVGQPTDEQTDSAVTKWLDKHPEATTTVQDHSLTINKMVVGTLGYVTPEMFGAKGDGVTDDTKAFTLCAQAANDNYPVLMTRGKTYLLTSGINFKSSLIGNGAIIKKETPAGKVNNNTLFFLNFSDIDNIFIRDLVIEDCSFYDESQKTLYQDVLAFKNVNFFIVENIKYYQRTIGICNPFDIFSNCQIGTIRNCSFIRNAGSLDGGSFVRCCEPYRETKNIVIENCVFESIGGCELLAIWAQEGIVQDILVKDCKFTSKKENDYRVPVVLLAGGTVSLAKTQQCKNIKFANCEIICGYVPRCLINCYANAGTNENVTLDRVKININGDDEWANTRNGVALIRGSRSCDLTLCNSDVLVSTAIDSAIISYATTIFNTSFSCLSNAYVNTSKIENVTVIGKSGGFSDIVKNCYFDQSKLEGVENFSISLGKITDNCIYKNRESGNNGFVPKDCKIIKNCQFYGGILNTVDENSSTEFYGNYFGEKTYITSNFKHPSLIKYNYNVANPPQ